jgi:hypothetical protein
MKSENRRSDVYYSSAEKKRRKECQFIEVCIHLNFLMTRKKKKKKRRSYFSLFLTFS